MSTVTASGWSNKKGTADRKCACASWKQHWLNSATGERWPSTCPILGCSVAPIVGGHVIDPAVSGEKTIPVCDSCDSLTGTSLDRLVTGV